MRSSSRLSRWLQSLRSFSQECYFLATPTNPFEMVNDSIVRAQALTGTGTVMKKGAYGLCQQANQLCRHVNLAAQRNPSAWQGPVIQRPAGTTNDEILKLALQIAAKNSEGGL